MQSVIYYLTATGEISGSSTFDDAATVGDITADMGVDESYMFGVADSARDYIDMTVPLVPLVAARPSIIDYSQIDVDADNTTVIDFALPTGTTVTFRGAETISGASEHFQFKSNGMVGTYEFEIDPPFPYIPVNLMVNANAV